MSLLLEARDLVGGYGGTDILNGVSLSLSREEIVVIVGPNGAGKSTAMKALFGLVTVRSGKVLLDGLDVTNAAPETLVKRGMAYVPQEANVFTTMTVEENLDMGAYTRRSGIQAAKDRVYDLLPALKAKRRQPAGELSGGQRQMVAIGRALMVDPKLLMLDEPSAGLSPKVLDEILDAILAINRSGVGVLMVEQNAKAALSMAHRGYVLQGGKNRFEGPGPALLANREIAELFLGG
jgi:branched-chain amino acid transport system ATP-binding protein